MVQDLYMAQDSPIHKGSANDETVGLSASPVAGFDELRVTGTRLSGARRGRRVDLTIRLRRNDR